MKIKYHWILAVVMTGIVAAASSGLAASSEAELMKQAKITKSQAEKIAMAAAHGGKIRSAEIEREQGQLVWSFDIAKPNTSTITEVLVNAETGKIVSIQKENTAQQAAETQADKKKH